MVVDEAIYLHATLRERFIAAAARDDEGVAQRLQPLIDGAESAAEQREDAWRLLSAGVQWAGRALSAAGITDSTVTPVRDSETAFDQAQGLEQKLFELSQLRDRSHDGEALVIDAVKRACYAGAELGPVPGGRLAIPGSIVSTIAPGEEYLQEVGGELGEALRRLGALALADVVEEAEKALMPASTHPGESLPKQVEVGDEFTGKVVKTVTFGAFVELSKGVDGLLHISDVAPGRRIQTVEEVLAKGDELKVRVVEIDRVRGRIGLRRADDPKVAGKTAEELSAVDSGSTEPRRARPAQSGTGRDRGRATRGRDRARDGDRDPDRGPVGDRDPNRPWS